MRRLHRAGLIAAGLVAPCIAAAHGDADVAGWHLDPLVGSLLLGSVGLQCIGLMRMGPARANVAPRWRVGAYAGAIATLVLALLSPLDALADAHFSWHMLQHLLLMLVAAPLLALSNAHFVVLFGLPKPWRRHVGRWLGWLPGAGAGSSHRAGPWLAALAFAASLWLWHAPRLYEAALANPTLHTLEHLTFLLTAAVFWRMVLTAGNRRLNLASAIVLVTLVGLQGNLMAALIYLASTVWTLRKLMR